MPDPTDPAAAARGTSQGAPADNPAPLGASADSAASGGHQSRADLPPAALRALAEAEDRRRAAAAQAARMAAVRPVELGGRDGPDPVRYGDWERKGLAIDF